MQKIRASGGYRQLKSFQVATIIYDGTYWFCERFLSQHSRTCDQMVQAARSGRQNIAEGSRAGAVSSQTELRLTNVARASLEELLLDYEDFLRHRRLVQWSVDSAEAQAVRQVGRKWTDRTDQTDVNNNTDEANQSLVTNNQNRSYLSNLSDKSGGKHVIEYTAYSQWLDHANPAIRANALICLIHQANYLLDRQIQVLEATFIKDGGYSERLASARLSQRNASRIHAGSSQESDDVHFPPCPVCGASMVLRTAKHGKEPGKQFLGCSTYPSCKGVAQL